MNTDAAKPYEPELGQMFFGQPSQAFELPEFAQALFFGLWGELGIMYWNHHQAEMNDRGYDPVDFVPGLEIRGYNWNEDNDTRPNFSFNGVEIHWYKYPGRGMSVNVDWAAAEWVAWFDKCFAELAGIREAESKNHMEGKP